MRVSWWAQTSDHDRVRTLAAVVTRDVRAVLLRYRWMYRPSSVLTSGGVEMMNAFPVVSPRSMSARSPLSAKCVNGEPARVTYYGVIKKNV